MNQEKVRAAAEVYLDSDLSFKEKRRRMVEITQGLSRNDAGLLSILAYIEMNKINRENKKVNK